MISLQYLGTISYKSNDLKFSDWDVMEGFPASLSSGSLLQVHKAEPTTPQIRFFLLPWSLKDSQAHEAWVVLAGTLKL